MEHDNAALQHKTGFACPAKALGAKAEASDCLISSAPRHRRSCNAKEKNFQFDDQHAVLARGLLGLCGPTNWSKVQFARNWLVGKKQWSTNDVKDNFALKILDQIVLIIFSLVSIFSSFP